MFKFIGLLVLPFTCYSSELAALHEGKANKGCLNTYLSQEILKANSHQDAEQLINWGRLMERPRSRGGREGSLPIYHP